MDNLEVLLKYERTAINGVVTLLHFRQIFRSITLKTAKNILGLQLQLQQLIVSSQKTNETLTISPNNLGKSHKL